MCHRLRAVVAFGQQKTLWWPEAVGSLCPNTMLRIRGDRSSLLAALAAHWVESQLAIPLALRTAPGTAKAQPPIPEKRITTGG